MVSSVICYVLWIVGLIVLTIVNYSNLTFSLLIISVLFPVVIAIIYAVCKVQIMYEIQLPQSTEKNQIINAKLILTNNSKLHYSNFRAKLNIYNKLTREKQILDIRTVMPSKSKIEIPIQLKSENCGYIQLTLSDVNLYDFTTLTYKKINLNDSQHIIVLPEIFTMNVRLRASQNGSNGEDEFSTIKSGSCLSEAFEYRDYVVGDSPKQINWKLSGKYDRLISKEGSLPIDNSIAIIIESATQQSNTDVFSGMIEVATSVVYELCSMKNNFDIVWYDFNEKSTFITRINDEEDIFALLPKILSINFENSKESTINTVIDELKMDEISHTIYITSMEKNTDIINNATVLYCKDNAENSDNGYVFTPENMSSNLYELEI